MKDPIAFADLRTLPLISDNAGPRYVLDSHALDAVRVAWAARRPLLVVGEPGCGKTQLAQALAAAWQVPLLRHTVNARTQAQDLLFHLDAVARLADAQIYGALSSTGGAAGGVSAALLNIAHYVNPGILWWAWNAQSARELLNSWPPHRRGSEPSDPYLINELTAWADTGVVLIDEIDKAPQDVPEALLDVLDTGSFDVPWGPRRITPQSAGKGVKAQLVRPFVVITSNDSRGLPAPLLRRCAVLSLRMPETNADAWLAARARGHFDAELCPDATVARAAEIVLHDRASAGPDASYRPGTAEFLDLLRAVVDIAPRNGRAQLTLLETFAAPVTSNKRAVSVA
jgi:MoxR-like ATPase